MVTTQATFMIFYFHMMMCLKKSCFSDCWEVTFVIPVSKNIGEKCNVEEKLLPC